MATTIASQLQAIRTLVRVEAEPTKRPFSRPSVIFNPEEAADIDIETVLNVSLTGLEALINIDKGFGSYKDLFSYKSKEIDRDLLNADDNEHMNALINSYLRLLSGHLHLSSALKTLEYLIRRYKIYMYNMDDLILCSLPYHETHSFVRIVQLLDLGNSKWRFLDGVKRSGAPPPRWVIVQQCVRDLSVLESICNYASPLKKYQPCKPVVYFCTSVTVGVIGCVATVEDTLLKKILPFIFSGLHSFAKGGVDHKAGILMIISLLAKKITLAPKLVASLVKMLSDLARGDAPESKASQYFRLSILTLINLIQSQNVRFLQKKALDSLNEIRSLPELLACLMKEFNVEKFVYVFLNSLVEHCCSEEQSSKTFISIIEALPLKKFIDKLVSRLLLCCTRIWTKTKDCTTLGTGMPDTVLVERMLLAIYNKYPSELREAVYKVLESEKDQFKVDILCNLFDGNMDMAARNSGSIKWLGLYHPKADVRRANISKLDSCQFGSLKEQTTDPQGCSDLRSAILRRLKDEDLTVVQEALSLKCLTEILESNSLLEALINLLQRCVHILRTGDCSIASDVAVNCLKRAVSEFKGRSIYREKLSLMIFPLLLAFPRTKILNFTALDLAKEVGWSFYENVTATPVNLKKVDRDRMILINMETLSGLAMSLLHSEESIPWLIACCNTTETSRMLFLLLLMRALAMHSADNCKVFQLVDACFPLLKSAWRKCEFAGCMVSMEKFERGDLDERCGDLLSELLDCYDGSLNAKVLVNSLWRISDALLSIEPAEISSDHGSKWLCMLCDLFVLLEETQHKHVLDTHIQYVMARMSAPLLLLRKLFTEEGTSVAIQISSLHCFASLCCRFEGDLPFVLLAEFPSLLVPMSNDNQSVRTACMECIQPLLELWLYVKALRKDGMKEIWEDFLGEVLDLMIQQQRLIISDISFLPSYLSSILSSSCSLLTAPKSVGRLDQAARESITCFILGSSLKLCAYAKVKIFCLFKEVGTRICRVAGVDLLLSELLERRQQCHLKMHCVARKLSTSEVELLCLLLENCAGCDGMDVGHIYRHIMNAMELNGDMEDDVVVKPCITVLEKLSERFYSCLRPEMQDKLFRQLIILFRSADGCIQNATRQLLLQIDVSCPSVNRILDIILVHRNVLVDLAQEKKSKKSVKQHSGSSIPEVDVLSLLTSLLDVLVFKKDIKDRVSLLHPLLRLLRNFFEDSLGRDAQDIIKNGEASSETCQNVVDAVHYAEQTLLLVLQDICSLEKDPVLTESNIQLLVDFSRFVIDPLTRNHVFSLLSTLSRINPDNIRPHVVDILSISIESTISQIDSYSRSVFENLVSGLVPCWLSKTNTIEDLLQMFVKMLPDVAKHRRLPTIIFLIRTLGEEQSLDSLLVVLFRSMATRTHGLKCILHERQNWEYALAVEVCEQYSCSTWIHSLGCLLQKIGMRCQSEEICWELLCAMKFSSHKLQDAQVIFEIESGDGRLQEKLADLMEQVVSKHIFHYRRNHKKDPIIKKQLIECMDAVLVTIMGYLRPYAYFNSVRKLLAYSDVNVRKKALQLLCDIGKDVGAAKVTRKGIVSRLNSHWLELDGEGMVSLEMMCFDIITLIDDFSDDSVASVKVQAVSALEILGKSFPMSSALPRCLICVRKGIASSNLSLSSCCLRTAGALINVLGPKGVNEFELLMNNILAKSNSLSLASSDASSENGISSAESLMLSLLLVLEAVVEKLGLFLGPYLNSIIEIVVLHPQFISPSSSKVKSKVCAIRELLPQRIQIRTLLPPLLDAYPSAVRSGHFGLSALFEMLANIVSLMEKSSISHWYAKIFDLCLQALDLRTKRLISIQDIRIVEEHVNHTAVTLTMKLTEAMFKPLFISSVDWAESNSMGTESPENMNIGRAISFYSLVDKLAESQRSLFVPYFKYLHEGCVRHLIEAGSMKSSRKKKAKLQHGDAVSLERWHLRALVLSCLHKCFVYDRGSQRFLDSSIFQQLLKPVVSQLSIDPPDCLEERPDIMPLEKVNDLLVCCIGQMAVTAGSDFLLKSLNHEVLMQTRNEKVRSRIVGLKIIRYLLENLKEEYLVFLPETIPFLAELLEDEELSVKTLAQEILKQMESMSGESLRQYL